ncbi:MAG: DUF3891 family protein [Psychroserpens sp.]|uniref:DUF3891 family protein n=1 Tax=Psychroserpens sp. TaxID=2020870 RepID=UPI003C7595C3
MIVNKTSNGYEIINHESHGLLAGHFAFMVSENFVSKYFYEVAIATAVHDDRQLDFNEKQYLSKNGIPLDFTEAPRDINAIVKRMNRVIGESNNKSSYIRLLISYHLEFLYSNLKNKSKKINAFFDNEYIIRPNILKVYQVTEETAKKDYDVLRFCDRLSLILCKDEVPTAGRALEINNSINGTTYFISRRKNGNVTVKPWVFNCSKFNVHLEVRKTENLKFDSIRRFENEFYNLEPNIQYWTFKK